MKLEFRAWTGKEMDYSDFGSIASFFEQGYNESDIMQYTGLKDENGKKVFSGDIVQPYYSEKIKAPLSEIKYIGRSFCMSQDNEESEIDCIWWNLFEVIGNKWENPELLEDK